MGKTAFVLEKWREGYTVDDINSLAPPGMFKTSNHVHVILSNMRKAGVLDREAAQRREHFSPRSFGKALWAKLTVEARRRHKTPFELTIQILTILFDEPVLLTNLLDDDDEKRDAIDDLLEAAE